MELEELLRTGRAIHAVGFDDAPFPGRRGARVPIVGAVCRNARLDGMVHGAVRKDGWNATAELVRLLEGGKFLPQLHVVLLDGLTFGGFNVVDLAELAARLERPCLAVMRRFPDQEAVVRAMAHLPRPVARRRRLERAGPVHEREGFVFQIRGASPAAGGRVLARLTERGHVPEPLRLAHLVAGALVHGESGGRA